MANSVQTEFQQILTAAKERRGDLSVDSMIVSSHLAQMRMFMLRRGIEFYAEQIHSASVVSLSLKYVKATCLI
jgi:hypothetical protein